MNKTFSAIIMSASATLAAAAPAVAADAPLIDRPDFHSTTGIFDIDALEALGRVSAPCVSPDGKTVLFGIAYESLEQNASNNDLYILDLTAPGARPERLTATPKSESGAVWFDGGRRIAFLYPDADGAMQMWAMNADGKGRMQLSAHPGGISGFLLSPDEKHVVVIGNVPITLPGPPRPAEKSYDAFRFEKKKHSIIVVTHAFHTNIALSTT